MQNGKCIFFWQFIPQWQRFLFSALILLVTLTFTLIGLTTGRFQVNIVNANLSVQRGLGQIELFLPLVAMITLILVRLLKTTHILIRMGSRVKTARQILCYLVVLVGMTTLVAWLIWLFAVSLFSRMDQVKVVFVANINFIMNMITALFTYTALTLIACLVIKSQAAGVFCGLSFVLVLYVAPAFGIVEMVTPQLVLDAIWKVQVLKQILLMGVSAGLLVGVLTRTRLPVEV